MGRRVDGEGRVEQRGDHDAGDEEDTDPVGSAVSGIILIEDIM